MLAYIQGTIIFLDSHSLIVRAGDLGYRIFVTEDTRMKSTLGDEAAFFLHQHIRENAEELYGFSSQQEFELFEHLISVSGVGPKSALSVLKLASVEDIISAIACGDAGLLKKVSGIGAKTAERIVVELKQSFQGRAVSHNGLEEKGGDVDDLIDALIRLGYARAQARAAVQSIPGSLETSEEKITYALRNIR
ncbi:MAG: Holliday junction branch migration protein RuvA [Candidatus Uhrbacteria bacterium]|nr:Holliday junction branch migration protein RuvA [Candidatus Uhrbacteria bacterium]